MLTIVSETYGLIVPGSPFPGGELKIDVLIRPDFEAELITMRIDKDDGIVFSNIPWPYTIIFVFGYSVILSLSKALRKEVHDRGGHLFHTLAGSYKLHFQKDCRYIIFSIHYAINFVRRNLEESAQAICTSWELLSPVFYFARAKIAKRDTLEQLSMLMMPTHPDLKTDFAKDEIARAILMEFLIEEPSSFQPSHIKRSQFHTFYKERDNLMRLALKVQPISKLLSLAGIRQVPLFRKRLRQLYDLNIRDFITEIRMAAAMSLLKDPTLSIKEIASRTGFSSAFYFSRVFSNYFSHPPKYFRVK